MRASPLVLLLCVGVLGCGSGTKPAKTPNATAKPPKVVPTSGNNDSKVGIDDPREMVQGIVNALAANDYEAFTQFTCLGMKKEEFKQFMNDNGDRKVIRVWDRAKDDFQAELKTNMHKAFLLLFLLSSATLTSQETAYLTTLETFKNHFNDANGKAVFEMMDSNMQQQLGIEKVTAIVTTFRNNLGSIVSFKLTISLSIQLESAL